MYLIYVLLPVFQGYMFDQLRDILLNVLRFIALQMLWYEITRLCRVYKHVCLISEFCCHVSKEVSLIVELLSVIKCVSKSERLPAKLFILRRRLCMEHDVQFAFLNESLWCMRKYFCFSFFNM